MADVRLDYETYSEQDITKGAEKYARHPSTEALMVGVQVGNAPVGVYDLTLPGSAESFRQSLCTLRDEGHICPDLFALFLRSEVHLRYAREYLKPEQIDEVDLAAALDG